MLKTVLQNSFPSSSTAAIMPNMSGNGGKLLGTDGTDAAWVNDNAVAMAIALGG